MIDGMIAKTLPAGDVNSRRRSMPGYCRLAVTGLAAQTVLIAVLTFAGFCSLPVSDTQAAGLEGLAGRAADISASAYEYRADRLANQNPPETAFLFETGIGHTHQGLLCGLLWEEPRAVNRIELTWPKEATHQPNVEQIELKWMPHGNSSSWWTRRDIKNNEQVFPMIAEKPIVSSDGRTFTYKVDATSPANAMDNVVVAVKGDIPSLNPTFAVPTLHVFTPELWKKASLDIEWGFQEGTEQSDFSGRIEIYNGVLGKVTPLRANDGVTVIGANAWQSKPDPSSRRGVSLDVLCLGTTYNTAIWPQQASLEDASRTIITVWTESGSFSFLPADLQTGPILAPEYGFFVSSGASKSTAAAFQQELAAKNHKTIRQQVSNHEEQNWEGAMRALHSEQVFPPYPKPEFEPAMKIDVPEQRLADAWRVGAWHLLRGCKKDAKGRYIIRDYPYDALAQETYLIIRVLDLMGMREAADQGLARWIERDDTNAIKMDGQFADTTGAMSGVEWDTAHTGGPGIMEWEMVEHYLLTRDDAWLRTAAPKLRANADWMIRQRKAFMKGVPGRERAWACGLLPPHNIWDSRNWRLWYESNAYYYLGLKDYAEVIAVMDPQAHQLYSSEAEAYARDITAALEKSWVLSPVIRARNGAYHSFLPPAPYIRGPASRQMPTSFGNPEHTPGLYADVIRGGVHLINRSQLLSPGDRRAQGMMDVLEDRLLLENHRLPMRTRNYDPQTDWFSGAGWYYQCGIERTPDIYLQWDDVPNFLRSFYNDYAVDIVVGPYTFNEHTTRGPDDKSFEEAAFLERLRNMLVMEETNSLWLARATPRAWLQQGKRISVKDAPTYFGPVSYEIMSDVEKGNITATVELPSRNSPDAILLRLRHPETTPFKGVTVNGSPWTDYDSKREVIRLHGLSGTVKVKAIY